MRALVLALALLAAPVSAHELIVSPRIGTAPLGVRARLVLDGDEERLYCPRVEWDYGDGSRSVHEEDCEPWGDGARGARILSPAKPHVYREGGHYVLTVRLYKGERKLLERTTDVRVMCGPMEPRCEEPE